MPRLFAVAIRARLAFVVAAVALVGSSASAIDLVLPLPKPTPPSVPLPKFLDEPGKKLSNEETKAIQESSGRVARDKRDKPRIADERPEEPSIALGPQFSDLLPYNVILGMVVCESNFPLDEVGGLQAEIAQLQVDLIHYLNIPQAREKIELCLFKDQESYRHFIKTVFPGAPIDRPALYVKDSGPGVLMVQRDDKMIVNIRHEMTHAYLNATLKKVPIWLDEGLAKYFETPPGERGFRNPYLKDVQGNTTGLFSSPPSLSRLEKLTRVDQMHSREYRESWSWVHFMIHYSRDTHLVLAEYLRTLRRDNPDAPTNEELSLFQRKTPMKKALEKYVPDYEKKYVEHFRNWDKNQAAYEHSRAESN